MHRKVFFVKQLLELPKDPAVYYLYNDDVLLYIGKSVNVLQRIRNHEREYRLGKHFNRPPYQEIDRLFNMVTRIEIELMDRYSILSREAFAIDWYDPKLNGITNSIFGVGIEGVKDWEAVE